MRFTIQVHTIFTDPNFVDETAVGQMLADANSIYSGRPHSVKFEAVSFERDFDPALSADGGGSGVGLNFETAREARAARYPGKLVIFFRPGNFAHSSEWADYIAMTGTSGVDFAHEVGHFLHLVHTHNEGVTNALWMANFERGHSAAMQLAGDLIRVAGGLSMFDGDFPAVTDTPPDPGPPLFQPSGYSPDRFTAVVANEHCAGTISLTVDGTSYLLSPDRNNVMSYFKGCTTTPNISSDQRQVIARALTSGNRRHLAEGAAPEGPAAVVTDGGHIHVFARGDNRNIWHSFWDGNSWSGWKSDLAAGTFSSGPAAVVTDGGQIHVFARGDDRKIWHSFWDGRCWSGWMSDLAAGTFSSAPAAVVSQGGHIHVFARGDDRNIWHSFWDGSAWSGWTADLGIGTFTSGAGAIVSDGGHIHVFARGEDRNIWHSFWDGSAWSGWTADLGIGTFTSGAGASVSAGGHIHVFARGDDRNIWHSFWDGGSWSGWTADLNVGSFMSGVAAVGDSRGVFHVFAQGDDRNIWHASFDGGNWSAWAADLGQQTFQP